MKEILKGYFAALCEGFWGAINLSKALIKFPSLAVWNHFKRVSGWRDVFILLGMVAAGYTCVFPESTFFHGYHDSSLMFVEGFGFLVAGVVGLTHLLIFAPRRG